MLAVTQTVPLLTVLAIILIVAGIIALIRGPQLLGAAVFAVGLILLLAYSNVLK